MLHPPSVAEFAALRDYLLLHLTPDPMTWTGVVCDHTLRLTSTWIASTGRDRARWTTWLRERNGDCDCTVLIAAIWATSEGAQIERAR